MAAIRKSKNHQMFTSKYEFFHDDRSDGDMYYAPINSIFNIYGYRAEARFFCTKMCWNYFGVEMAKRASGDV